MTDIVFFTIVQLVISISSGLLGVKLVKSKTEEGQLTGMAFICISVLMLLNSIFGNTHAKF